MKPSCVYIGLGSNLNDPLAQLQKALKALRQLLNSELVAHSRFYRSQSLLPEQPDYCNAVAQLLTQLTPLQLLHCLQQIEVNQGRTREQAWGPRTLDCDILLFGQRVINNSRLSIPHTEISKRIFVVYPLAELAPQLILPIYGPIEPIYATFSPDKIRIW